MRLIPVSILFLIVYSCRNKQIQTNADQKIVDPVSNTTSFSYPFKTHSDTGFFQGYPSYKLDLPWEEDNSGLSKALNEIVSKKDVVLLDSATLSHSVFIDQVSKIRMDTLRSSNNLIISRYEFGDEKVNQEITFNGKQWKVEDSPLDVDGSSFRHFAFKGREFYYINGNLMDMIGASAGNVTYHFLFDSALNVVGNFQTCRFDQKLFGDVDGDATLDYLDFNNNEFCTTVPYSDNVRIEFYSIDGNKFKIQSDKKGTPFFILGRTGDSFKQDSLVISDSYWPSKINSDNK